MPLRKFDAERLAAAAAQHDGYQYNLNLEEAYIRAWKDRGSPLSPIGNPMSSILESYTGQPGNFLVDGIIYNYSMRYFSLLAIGNLDLRGIKLEQAIRAGETPRQVHRSFSFWLWDGDQHVLGWEGEHFPEARMGYLQGVPCINRHKLLEV